jgi:chemotaxis protein methyltransferase CheR
MREGTTGGAGNTQRDAGASEISDQLLARFSEFVTTRFGLHYPKKRWRDLAQRIELLINDFACADAEACVRRLTSTELTRSELDILADRLTIGETYFFRERKSFDLLEEQILPPLLASRRERDRRLRIWSAGCSTGEEAYSIAMLLQRMIADLQSWNLSILATDLNPAALRRAVRGEYGDWSFRGVPTGIRERFFNAAGGGRFEVVPAIRRMVTFAQLNLAEDPYPSLATNTNAMDIIFCRNVLMYFAPQQMERAIEGFRHALVDGGLLVVSPCETSHTLFSRFEAVAFRDAIFYRKNGQGKVRSAPRPGTVRPVPAAPLPPQQAIPPPAVAPPASAAVPPAAKQPPSPHEEALALYRQGLYAEAAAKLTGAVATGENDMGAPPSGKAAVLLTRIFANLGDLTAALEWAARAVAGNKLDPELRYLQATILLEQGDADSAATALKKALYLDHTFVLAHYALANLSLRRRKPKEAAKHLGNAASLLTSYGPDDLLPGSEGMNARRFGEIITAAKASMAR